MRIGRALFVGLAAFGLATPGSDARGECEDRGDERSVKIAYLANDPTNTYDGATREAIIAVAAGSHSKVFPFYAGFDPTVQLQQCFQALDARTYDAIILTAADSNAIIPCVTEAKARHVPVVAVDLPIGPDITTFEPQVPGEVGSVLVPPADWGTDLASLVVDACGSQSACDVAYIAGAFTVALDIAALQQLNAAAAAHSNIRIVATGQAFYDTPTAQAVATAMLAAQPTINVMIGAGDQMAQGAETAINLAGLPQPIKIIGAGAGAYGVSAVRAGRWYATFVALPREEGTFGAQIALAAARHKPIAQPGINPVQALGLPPFLTTTNQALFAGFQAEWQ
jgi:ribose transport system substrate-binding protein